MKPEIIELIKTYISDSPEGKGLTIAEIAYNMDWEYSTASQKLRVLVAGKILKKIETRRGSVKYIIPMGVEE